MWFASLFSFIPALVIMLVMDRWVEREVSVANRLSAQLMLMSCGLFLGLAVVLRMDMLMCMFYCACSSYFLSDAERARQ